MRADQSVGSGDGQHRPEAEDEGVSPEVVRELIRRSLASARVASPDLRHWSSPDPSTGALGLMPGPPRNHRPLDGLATGYRDVDAILGGLHPGELITIAGLPSSGTSTLTQNVVRKIAVRAFATETRTPEGVALFSFDTTRERIALRLLCAQGRVDPHAAATGRITGAERAALAEAKEQFRHGALHVGDAFDGTVADVHRACARLKEARLLDLVVIDRLDGMGAALSRTLSALKAMAAELAVPVMVNFSIEPGRVDAPDRRPRLGHLPAAVRLLSDVIAVLHRPDYWTPQGDAQDRDANDAPKQKGVEVLELWVEYQKGGTADVARLIFYTRWGRLASVPWEAVAE